MRHSPHSMPARRTDQQTAVRQTAAGRALWDLPHPLFHGHPASVDGARFEKHKRESDLPILMDVWALAGAAIDRLTSSASKGANERGSRLLSRAPPHE
jgi:hypothetical protein